jgi:peroxiredoxin
MPVRHFPWLAAAACIAALAAQLPRPAPDFAIRTDAGPPIQLAQYRGKVVVLAFILTTCPHCQRAVGVLSKMQKEYGSQGLQVLGSATEAAAPSNLPAFMERFQPAFPVGFSNHEAAVAFLQHPEKALMLMPQVVFIDRKGVIRAQYEGGDKFLVENQEANIRGEIEALLKGPR